MIGRALGAALLAAAVLFGCEKPADTTSAPPPPPPAPAPEAGQDLTAGKLLFGLNCAICHGDKGLGDGRAAEYLFPKPRDLSSGHYKIRSTESGAMPTDDDMFGTITRGIPGSSMPSFEFLAEKERRDLVAYVKSLAVLEDEGETLNLFELRGGGRVIRPGTPPKGTDELVARGKVVYEEMGCAKCHGESGVGDGDSAPTLVDSVGKPIPPANFTRGVFKGGDRVEDVYLRFTTGMNGTPMPSFESSLPDKDRWALAYYVKSLVRKDQKSLAHASRKPIRAARAAEVPMDPADKAWASAEGVEVPLMLLWQRAAAPNYLTVRALKSDRHAGLSLEWPDASADGLALRPQDFSDAAAAMFALTDPPGDITMGSKERPVNLWQWRFGRQMDAAAFRDIETQFPGMVGDEYFLAKPYYPKNAKFPGHEPVAPAPQHDPTYLTGWGAGNNLSNPRPTSAVEDLNAQGFGTLAPQAPEHQDVEGRGVWDSGRWKVVLRRPLAGSGQDVSFAARRVWVSFATWDGSAGDRDGQKAVSYWHELLLE